MDLIFISENNEIPPLIQFTIFPKKFEIIHPNDIHLTIYIKGSYFNLLKGKINNNFFNRIISFLGTLD